MSTNVTTKEYISKIGDEISNLRGEVAALFANGKSSTFQNNVSGLADYGRDRLNASGDFAAAQLRYVRDHPGKSSIGIAGGLILLGAVGAGIYYLCKSDCDKTTSREDESLKGENTQGEAKLPSYIS